MTAPKCDGPDCAAKPALYCGCRRCDSEKATTEVFFACSKHREAGDAKHRRIRGYPAEWYDGTAEERERFLRPVR